MCYNVVIYRQKVAHHGKTETTSNREYKKSFALQCISQLWDVFINLIINPHLDPQVHLYEKINPETPVNADKIYLNEMGEYVNVKTEPNSKKPDDNPYVVLNGANPYLAPNVSK